MKIICIGRNYVDHIAELKNEVPDEPVVFLKPDTAYNKNRQDFYIPEFTQDLHYEAEIVLRINKMGKHIDEKFARRYFDAISIGIDFTARDLQAKLKAKGLPWEKAKAFDFSAAVGDLAPADDYPDMGNINFNLDINGKTVQQGNTGLTINNFNQIIAYVSKFFTLKKGDLIFTGTPAGVGPVKIGDKLEGYIEGKKLLEFGIR
ncbi:MAG: fumarylacetoacetate hydrolase family protein [Sphingobacteriales bacterium JAD_PAG50586_3]|nr:MAG: fumarylacetoacetate hydrolase family protein [Sphingobacteriales bacterium JAD_PAG50586_3]